MASKAVKYLLWGGVVVVGGGIALSYMIGSNPLITGAAVMNEALSIDNPAGEIKIELRDRARQADFPAPRLAAVAPGLDPGDEWHAYNRTVYGDRFSTLTQINADNAARLKVVCSYDSERLEGFQVTPLVINGALIGTTAEDIFSIDPVTCKENWRTHEDSGIGLMPVNRGAAYSNGKLFRGYPDGYVRAYDLDTGSKVWETFVGDNNETIWLTSAAMAWDGMVYYGTAGGDLHNIRGRVFGLDAETGEVMWQVFTVPKQAGDTVHATEGQMPVDKMAASWRNPPDIPVTGGGVWTTITIDPSTGLIYVPVGNPAPDFVKSVRPGSNLFTNTMLVLNAKSGDYVKHYSIMADDWHDWDISNAPILYTTRGGADVLTFHPKDGHVYSYNRGTDDQLFRMPVTKMLNTDAEFSEDRDTYFCPGSVGGGEWSSAAYDPQYNLVFTGQNEWCTTARIAPVNEVNKARDGMIWFGVDYINPYHLIGITDPVEKWGGWIYATDADSGQWKWRARANYPTISGVTPTAGGIVAFGDMGGYFRVLRASDGEKLFEQHFEGAIAGGVITYAVNDLQYIAFTSGVNHPQWPVKPSSGKIIVMTVDEP